MKRLRYLFLYFWFNKIKILLFVLIPLSFNIAHNYPESLNEDKFIYQFKDNKGYNYLKSFNDGYSTIKFDVPQKIITKFGDQYITYYDTSWQTYVLYALGIALAITLVIMSFHSETGWVEQNEYINCKYLLKYVNCVIEENKHIYTIFGRLLCKSDKRLDDYDIKRKLLDFSAAKELFPLYKTKTEKRNNSLNEIGI